MKKKVFLLLTIALVSILALFTLTACNSNKTTEGVDIFATLNGDFESFTETDDTKTLSNWHTFAEDGSKVALQHTDDSAFGEYYLVLSTSNGKKYVYQNFAVDKNSVYKVTVNVRIKENLSSDEGAYVTFKENMDYKFILASDVSKYGTNWKEETFYIRPKNMNSLTICLGVNVGAAASTKAAYFDNLSVTKVNPNSVTNTIYDIKQTVDSATYNSTTIGIVFIVVLTVLSLCVIYGTYIIIRRLYSKQDCFTNIDASFDKNGKPITGIKKNSWFIVCILMLVTFLVRLIMLLTTYGMGQNMTSLLNIGYSIRTTSALTEAYKSVIVNGPSTSDSFSMLSPGVAYILSILCNIIDPSINKFGTAILVRMIAVLSDMAIVAMIYFFGKKYVGNKISTVYSGLYAILPISFILSGYIGTFEILVIALTLGAIILMIEKRYIPMYILMILATLVHIEALAVAPIMIAYLVYQWYKEDKDLKIITFNRIAIPLGLVVSVVLLYVLLLPVSISTISAKPFGGFQILINEMSGNTIFVNNAFNLYSMVGMNMTTANSTASILNLIFLIILEIYIVSLYLHNKNKMETLLLCSFIFAVIAVFTLKITYTYLILAIVFGLIYTMISGDRRMYFIMGVYAILLFLNVAQLTNLSGLFVQNQTIGSSVSTYDSIKVASYYELDAFLIFFSIIAVLVTLYYFYVSYSITNNEKIKDIKPMTETYPKYLKRFFKDFTKNIKDIFTPNNKKNNE